MGGWRVMKITCVREMSIALMDLLEYGLARFLGRKDESRARIM